MSKYRYGKAYIRLYKKGDMARSMVEAFGLAAKIILNKKAPYVLVRHGFKGDVMAFDDSKEELLERLCVGRNKKDVFKSFKVKK